MATRSSSGNSNATTEPTVPPMWFTLAAIAAILCGLVEMWVGYGLLSHPDPRPFADQPPDIFDNLGVFARYLYVAAAGVGLVGGILLLLRKKWAPLAFMVALIGCIQPVFLSSSHIVVPIVSFAIALGELLFATMAGQRGWLA